MQFCQALFSHKSKICPWLISTVWKHPLPDKVFMYNLSRHNIHHVTLFERKVVEPGQNEQQKVGCITHPLSLLQCKCELI